VRLLPKTATFCSSKLRSLVCGPPFPLMSRFGGCQGVSLELLSESWQRVLLLGPRRRRRQMGRVNLWAVRRAGRLARGDGRIRTSLHESDLQSVEAGRHATGGRAERGRRGGVREPYAENVALPGLRFTWAFMLSYGGSPMGVLAYVDPLGAPVLLCILANGAPDARTQSERRFVARLVVAERTRSSGHRPRSGGAGRRARANDREASLRSGRLRTHRRL
jgi:hypothetical protein